mmetsp:Transcript_27617/g.55285  ORF Transcript_27617/g.55285 Transcript_27617/m.55285 type:complete len:146 (+) Transcript_27617:497-934(+)
MSSALSTSPPPEEGPLRVSLLGELFGANAEQLEDESLERTKEGAVVVYPPQQGGVRVKRRVPLRGKERSEPLQHGSLQDPVVVSPQSCCQHGGDPRPARRTPQHPPPSVPPLFFQRPLSSSLSPLAPATDSRAIPPRRRRRSPPR